MDFATDEEREFVAGAMMQENRLQKALKELNLDSPFNGPPPPTPTPSPTTAPPLDESPSSSSCVTLSVSALPSTTSQQAVQVCAPTVQ